MMKKIQVSSLNQFLNQMAYPNRIMALVVMLVIIFVAWFLILKMPQMRTYQKKYATKITIESEVAKLKAERDIILALLKGRSDSKARQDLKTQLEKADESLQIYQDEMVPFDKMSSVVRNVLKEETGLNLVSLHTTDRQRLIKTEGLFANGSTQLLQQNLDLALSGNYPDLLSYLDRLESSEYRFFWDSLSYRVTEYPNAVIEIRLHTVGY